MADGHAIWLTAAARTMASAPATRFCDLPPKQRREIIRLGFLSAVASAYTLAMVILAQPIPSRSLVTHATLPHGGTPRSPLMEALLMESAPPARPTTLKRPARAKQPAVTSIAMADADPAPEVALPARRGNVFGRFFKGVWRTLQ